MTNANPRPALPGPEVSGAPADLLAVLLAIARRALADQTTDDQPTEDNPASRAVSPREQ